MRIILSMLWLTLAVAWAAAFAFLGKIIGGFQYISHVGMSMPAAMNILISILCLISAVFVLPPRVFPKSLVVTIGVVAGIHFVNAIGSYILIITNGHAGGFLVPFFLFAKVLTTNSQFIGMPVGNFSLLLLPLLSLALLILTLSLRGSSPAHQAASDDS